MIEKAETLNNQAIRLSYHGEYSEAIACFKRALIIEQNNSLIWYNLGITYQSIGDFNNAYFAFKKAFDLDSQNLELIETIANCCISNNDLNQARFYCYEGLSVEYSTPHLWNTLGVINFKEENFLEASECFEYAVSLTPYYEDAIFNLRDTYSELKNDKGVSECQKRLNAFK